MRSAKLAMRRPPGGTALENSDQLTISSHHIRRDTELQAARGAKVAAVTSYCNGWLDRGHLEQLFLTNPMWRDA